VKLSAKDGIAVAVSDDMATIAAVISFLMQVSVRLALLQRPDEAIVS
jgi:hypothetical protein